MSSLTCLPNLAESIPGLLKHLQIRALDINVMFLRQHLPENLAPLPHPQLAVFFFTFWGVFDTMTQKKLSGGGKYCFTGTVSRDGLGCFGYESIEDIDLMR
jgi:hypothetical protein